MRRFRFARSLSRCSASRRASVRPFVRAPVAGARRSRAVLRIPFPSPSAAGMGCRRRFRCCETTESRPAPSARPSRPSARTPRMPPRRGCGGVAKRSPASKGRSSKGRPGRASSSVGQSTRLISVGSEVQVLPGPCRPAGRPVGRIGEGGRRRSRGRSSAGRAPALQAGGRRFESDRLQARGRPGARRRACVVRVRACAPSLSAARWAAARWCVPPPEPIAALGALRGGGGGACSFTGESGLGVVFASDRRARGCWAVAAVVLWLFPARAWFGPVPER